MRQRTERGVTLIDTLVGSALMLIVFLGIGAAFKLSVEVVTNNKARAGAIALANERMEYLKSLTYPQIGVEGGIPAGNVPQLETVSLSGTTYTRRTSVYYSDDPYDGEGAADSNDIIADYKTIRVEVSWESRQGERSIELIGRVSPTGIETAVPGGTLTIIVVNAGNIPLQNAQVQIVNASTSPIVNITSYTGADGTISFIGAPAASNYQITVTKNGYSTAQTYSATTLNPNPTPRHLTVVDDQTTASTFAIDTLGSKTFLVYKQIVPVTWSDTFSDLTQVSTSSRIALSSGDVVLAGAPSYESSGFIESIALQPTYLAKWKSANFVSTTSPQTTLLFRLYDATGGGSTLIPDSALPGNSAGFATSSINLSSLSTSTYSALKLRADLTTSNASNTPSIGSWSITYDYGPEPLPDFTFTMRGNKTIGNSPTVYKYDTQISSGASSQITLPSMEWDTYAVGVATSSAYELAESCLPQPQSLSPGESQTTNLYFLPATSHSLLVDVKGSGGESIEDASVRLTRAGFDDTDATSSCGQSFFSGLVSDAYTVDVTKSGYQAYSIAGLNVVGDTALSVVLLPI